MADQVISVVIPVYNARQSLERCVHSVIGQCYSALEVILVDDGSTDGSGPICDQLAATDSRIQVIHKPNGGVSSARNKGIEVATGEYLQFVDCLSHQPSLEQVVSARLGCFLFSGDITGRRAPL